MVYDKHALQQDFNKVKAGTPYEGTIREIMQTTAGDVFGDKAENPDRDVILMKVEVTDGETFSETMSLPKTPGSWKRENFKLAAFVKHYGEMPDVGMKVQVKISDDGYYRVAVD